MSSVTGQLPGQQIDDYFSMLSNSSDADDALSQKGAEMQSLSLI